MNKYSKLGGKKENMTGKKKGRGEEETKQKNNEGYENRDEL